MEKFFNQTLNSYFPSYTRTVIIKGFEIKQFNVYFDWVEALLVNQCAYYNAEEEVEEINSEPSREEFLVFYEAYEQVEQERKKSNKKSEHEAVIEDLQTRFIKWAIPRGYKAEILFTIMYIALDRNAYTSLTEKVNQLDF